MSTTIDGIPEESDWARPPGCHCFTWRQREACYENCDPVEPKKSMPKKYWLILIVCVILPLLALIGMIVLAMFSTKARAADLVAWRPPTYCGTMKLMERSCKSVWVIEKLYGRAEAERRARACGATDADIAEAQACQQQKK